MEEENKSVSSQEVLKTERYLWIARAFSAVAILATVANVLLFAAIGSLYPLVRIQPFYLDILDKNQQVIDIAPISANELQSERVVEALVRQYVLARNEIGQDILEIEERFGPDGIIALMSSEDVYRGFLEFYQRDLEEPIRQEGLTISASIDTMSKIANNFQWRVYLTLKMNRQNSVEPEVVRLIVNLEVQFDPLFKKATRLTWQDRLKNPLGFRVVSYGWEEVKK